MDAATQRQLARGQRLQELLKQKQYSPMSVDNQVIAIFAVTNGYMDKVPVDKVQKYESSLMSYLQAKNPACVKTLKDTAALDDATRAQLMDVLKEFTEQFLAQA